MRDEPTWGIAFRKARLAMDKAVVVIVLVSCLVVCAWLWRWKTPKAVGEFSAVNDLERAMLGAKDKPGEILDKLAHTTVYATVDAAGEIATLTVSMPALAGSADGAAQGENEDFGPWVVCFTSPERWQQTQTTPVGRSLSDIWDPPKPISFKKVAESAERQNCDIVMNLFTPLSVRIPRSELRAMREATQVE